MKAKKLLTLILAAVMLLTCFAGCASKEAPAVTTAATQAAAETKEPASEEKDVPSLPLPEKVNLKGFGCSFAGQAPWEEMLLFKELEERTNIHIDWEYMEQSPQLTERVNMMFATGETPDVMIRVGQGGSNRDTVIKWGENGLVLDLAPLIEEYAPNLQAMLEKYPDVRSAITTPEGKIYVLPTVYDYKAFQVFRTLQINTYWLERVGKDVPETLDELVDVLKAFRDQDANGNGDPNDEVPYSAHTFEFTMRGIASSFGLNWAYGMPAVFKDGKYENAATSDEFKACLEYLKMMYEEKLLDPEIFSQTNARFHGMLPADEYGCVVFGFTPNAGAEVAPQLKSLPPMIGPSGADNRPWSFMTSVVKSDCSCLIPATCTDPVSTIKWLDYLYSEEGSDLMWLGVKDVTYVENPDGTFSYVDSILNAPEGYSKKMGEYCITWGSGTEPGVFTERQLSPGYENTDMEERVAIVEPFLQDVAVTVMPILTADKQEEWEMITDELNPYVKEMWAKFVSGEASFDQWDTYCKTAESLGLSRMEEMIKEAAGL